MTGWAQKMSTSFVDFDGLKSALLPEMRFIDSAIKIETGTEIRKYAYEFCEAEGIAVEALSEGVRR